MLKTVEKDAVADAYEAWLSRIETTHGGANHRINPEAAFTLPAKPLSDSTMALVTTAGAHLDDQTPFDVTSPTGDASWREIPDDADRARIRFSHTHYDTSSAETDPNVVLPLDRLGEAVESGRIGAAAPFHIGMMGFNPDPSEIADTTGPAVAERLVAAGVDVAMLVPG